MKKGRPPYAADDKQMQLHHMLQTQEGPIAEVTGSFHSANSKIIHWKSGTKIPSGIDRPAFKKWRERYWENRAKGFGG
ncbi:hypothetical protein M2158_009221 [Streptomyces sp. SAI-144]|nr:HNH/ENDO VII family nuclease [Streptomyces sp. SAI-144]MDH6440680.1 hypothetical protein [Streptomyces sp. SAI-144]